MTTLRRHVVSGVSILSIAGLAATAFAAPPIKAPVRDKRVVDRGYAKVRFAAPTQAAAFSYRTFDGKRLNVNYRGKHAPGIIVERRTSIKDPAPQQIKLSGQQLGQIRDAKGLVARTERRVAEKQLARGFGVARRDR